LSEDLDPKSSKSVLGAALQTLRDFLNPKNTESIQNVLDQAVNKATADNGVLAKAVKMQVEDALKPLLAEIDGLAKEIRGQEAAEEALEQTILKGSKLATSWFTANGSKSDLNRYGGEDCSTKC
jgi:hypothetical protein